MWDGMNQMDTQNLFLGEMKEYFGGRTNRIRHASTLTNHGMRLHRQRLAKYGYWIDYGIEYRSDKSVYSENERFSDALYKVTCTMIPVFLTTNYVSNGRLVFAAKEEKKFTTYMEDLADGRTTLNEDEVINCPNCGYAGTVNDFRSGCVGCGTHFEMTDVYPSVGTYFFMDDLSAATSNSSEPGQRSGNVVDGYKKVFKILAKAPMALDAASTISLKSLKEYQDFMRPYRPDFSYVHFANEAISMMTMMIYSDAPEKLPFNKMMNNSFIIAPNLIDFTIEGFGMNHGDYAIEGNVARVTCTLYMTSVYDEGGRIRKAREKYQATFVRDITKPISQNFSFTRINCSSCAGVFDAMNGKFCPYCGKEYVLNNEEWVVVDMRRA